ncbi:MAG: amidohydrolase [Haloferacaceae archaeon]
MARDSVRRRTSELRRTFHQYPEPSWCEFHTTGRIVDELEGIGVDEIHLGSDALDPEGRMGLPSADELETWHRRAADRGTREDVLDRAEGGLTGAVAVLERGDGPTVGLRVDIDALPITESTDPAHVPAAEGFRSENEGYMHACGHDAHTTIGLGVVEAVRESDFAGTLKVFFQPAEEVLGGGRQMARTRHVEDVDHFFAVHVGLNHPSGEVVAGADRPLSVRQLDARFTGESAHAGLSPNRGRNAMHAAAAATENLYGIPRHEDGLTRVNVGRIEGGTACNIVAESVEMELEVRGGTDDLRDYVGDHADRILRTAAEMHDCDVETEVVAEGPREDSDDALRAVVGEVAREIDGVDSVVPAAPFGASEDATYLMRAVKERGGTATFVVVGTDHPGSHHSPTFDVDESSVDVGIDVLAGAIGRLGGSD